MYKVRWTVLQCYSYSKQAMVAIWVNAQQITAVQFYKMIIDFQVQYPCKWESVFFLLNKETSCEIEKVRK